MSKETRRVVGKRPLGGFMLIRADQLFALWWCYERALIELADVRMWFALQEVVARRSTMEPGRKPTFTSTELMELTGKRRRPAIKASLRRLEQAGLVTSRRSSIVFARSLDDIALGDRAAFDERLALIANNRRRVPVPRRVLRWLAAKSRRVAIASVLGHLLRLLYLRNGCCRADGNCKSSWLAEVFAIDLRSAKRGRKELLERGLLIAEDVPQWYQNRYGWRGAVNLNWAVNNSGLNEPVERPNPPPRSRNTRSELPPPRQDKKLSSRITNQQPASGRIGSLRRIRGRISHVDVNDLRDDRRLVALFRQAVGASIVGRDDRLNVFAAAEHALRVGRRNPAGLFVWLLVNRRWGYLTQVDEDAARCRLKCLHESEPTSLAPPGAASRLLSAVRRRAAGFPELPGMTHVSEILRQCLAA